MVWRLKQSLNYRGVLNKALTIEHTAHNQDMTEVEFASPSRSEGAESGLLDSGNGP